MKKRIAMGLHRTRKTKVVIAVLLERLLKVPGALLQSEMVRAGQVVTLEFERLFAPRGENGIAALVLVHNDVQKQQIL
jgi:hypothetical protein